MEVLFKSGKLQKICNSQKALRRQYGTVNGDRIASRLVEMEAVNTLADLFAIPQARCHAMTADRRGQFSVDVEHPYRLFFEPADEPVPTKSDGSIDLARVKAVRVLEIADPHGK